MDTRPFFSFIDAVYAFNGQKRTVDALCSGKLRFGKWAESMSNKRRAFEACAFTCCAESPDFREQLTIYYDRLKTSMENYEKSRWFDNQYDIKTQKREFFEQKYHEVRRKEITIAYNYLTALMGKATSTNYDESHYIDIYTIEQLNTIFDYLIENKHLDPKAKREDFIYYFSGKGEIPLMPLRWIGTKINAAFFIEAFYDKDAKKWKKAERVLGFTRLNNSLSCLSYSDRKNPFEELKNKI